MFLKLCAIVIFVVLFLMIGVYTLVTLVMSGLFKEFQILFSILILSTILYLCLRKWLRKNRAITKIYCVILVSIVIAGSGFLANYSYNLSIPTLSDQDVNLYKYEPFVNGSKAAVLPKPSTLRLEADLPRIDCATALYPVMAAFVQATYPFDKYSVRDYEKSDPVHQTNTADAYKDLIEGNVDIIFVAGPSEQQLKDAELAGVELTLTPIGREAFVFFVNFKNPIDGLTVDQVQKIYSGEITSWKDVGGNNDTIRAFQRPQDSGSQTALQKLMAGKALMTPPTEDVVGMMGGIIEQTADYKNYGNAIGYSFRYFCTEMVQNNQIKLLALNGVYPDKESIRSGAYPLASHFYAVTAGSDNPNVKVLIDWICSEEGQYLIEETGYVGVE